MSTAAAAISDQTLLPVRYPLWNRPVVLLIALNFALSILTLTRGVARPNGYDPAGYMAWEQAVLAGEGVDPTVRLAGNAFFPDVWINGRSRAIDKFPIGWSLAVFPFAAAGQGFCWVMNHGLGRHYALDGTAAPVVRMAWFGVALWTTAGLFAAYTVLRRLFNPRAAAFGFLIAYLGTAATAYAWRSPGSSHALSLSFVALCYLCGLSGAGAEQSGRSRGRQAVLWGVAAGMVFCLRHLNVILILPSALLLLYRTFPPAASDVDPRARAASPRGPDWSIAPRMITAAALGAFPFLFLQSLVWRLDYGRWYFNGYAFFGEHFSLNLHNLTLFLFSSLHGLFFWHLVTAVSIAGLCRIARRSVFGVGVLGAMVASILLYGFWWDWDLGPGYGARWTTDSLLLWAIGIASVTSDRAGQFQPRRAAVIALVALPSLLLVAAQLAGRVSTYSHLHIYLPTSGWRELP